jgi:hypothetical protein
MSFVYRSVPVSDSPSTSKIVLWRLYTHSLYNSELALSEIHASLHCRSLVDALLTAINHACLETLTMVSTEDLMHLRPQPPTIAGLSVKRIFQKFLKSIRHHTSPQNPRSSHFLRPFPKIKWFVSGWQCSVRFLQTPELPGVLDSNVCLSLICMLFRSVCTPKIAMSSTTCSRLC